MIERALILAMLCFGSQASQLAGSTLSSIVQRPFLSTHCMLRLRGGGKVVFEVECKSTKFGECVGIVGSSPKLGDWKSPLKLDGKKYPKWQIEIDVNPSESLEYKYCIVDNSGHIKSWEPGGEGINRRLKPSPELLASGKWSDGHYGLIRGAAKVASQPPPPPHELHGHEHPIDLGNHHEVRVEHDDELDKFGHALVEADRQAGSWRQKLEVVKDLFYDQRAAAAAGFSPAAPRTEHLASIAIYLHFLASGQVACAEDGRHFRPNHHSMLASAIDRALDKVEASPETSYLIRKIRPMLPSYASAYTAQVPLTRIRDIAHRSDIPKDLKDDIKHNLQNKLHRCAGPEDLVTAERILKQVESGSYAPAFVAEMRTFMGELRQFFNAGGLEDRLRDLLAKEEPTPAAAGRVGEFLAEKSRPLAPGAAAAAARLRSLTALREELLRGVAAAAGDAKEEARQRARLADAGLDQYAFVLLAAGAHELEQQAGRKELDWTLAMSLAAMALDNARLSESVPVEEAAALSREAVALGKAAGAGGAAGMMRCKAWLDRCLRVCGGFSDRLQRLFLARVLPLGQALGVAPHASHVFVEAEVRASVVFQLSRIASASLRVAKARLGAPPWAALQPGAASGVLRQYPSLAALVASGGASATEPQVVLLEAAEGDEDIPPSVVGVVLAQELPLLSHLGVRARQQGVVFACSDGPEAFAKLREGLGGLWGKPATLRVDAAGAVSVQAGAAAAAKPRAAAAASPGAAPPPPRVIAGGAGAGPARVVACGEACGEAVAGAKAAAAGVIEQLARASGGAFLAPAGCAVPFAVMDKAAADSWDEYKAKADAFDAEVAAAGPAGGALAEARAAEMRAFVAQRWKVDPAVTKDIVAVTAASAAACGHGGGGEGDVRIMVRSSANVEDLEGMSGAGLYDSIANVPVGDPAAIAAAVASVWGSLWTKRAALSRRAAAVPHAAARMGILVQRMVRADIAFVAFSDNPISRDPGQVYMELCLGMGETLASANQAGTPYRVVYSKKEQAASTLALSSLSHALRPAPGGGGEALTPEVIDYSAVPFHTDEQHRQELAGRIARAVMALAKARGSAQDVEGVVQYVGGGGGGGAAEARVYIVQARPMVLSPA